MLPRVGDMSRALLAGATAALLAAASPAAAQTARTVERPSLSPGGSKDVGLPAIHPLMTAEAIRAAAANFRACLEGLWPEAERRGIPRAAFDGQLAGLTPDLKIMDAMEAQPEFNKSLWDYLDQHVSEDRIKRGREMLAKHRPIFGTVENAYGVDRHLLAAIWGVETNYGAGLEDRPVVRSTATLACIGRRQNRFRAELLGVLEMLQHGEIRPDRLKGGWAGAFGPMGFIPTSFQRFAVDFDGDGRRDVVDSIPDMLASAANNLKQTGWIPGETWGQEVVIPAGFNYLLADSWRWNKVRDWERLGVAPAREKTFPRPDALAYLSLPAGSGGPALLLSYNFRVLLHYNPAEAYALAVGHLADRLRGEGPFAHPWPRVERALSSAERFELQQLLARRGFDIGGAPDGLIGPQSRGAIQRFQAAAGMIPDGFASAAVLSRLRLQ